MNKQKTKFIRKALKNGSKPPPDTQDNNGEPVIKSLSDFVTAVTPLFASRPIYTGGRILQAGAGQNLRELQPSSLSLRPVQQQSPKHNHNRKFSPN